MQLFRSMTSLDNLNAISLFCTEDSEKNMWSWSQTEDVWRSGEFSQTAGMTAQEDFSEREKEAPLYQDQYQARPKQMDHASDL